MSSNAELDEAVANIVRLIREARDRITLDEFERENGPIDVVIAKLAGSAEIQGHQKAGV